MRYIVVDCETSGLSHEKNKILTVGLLYAKITKSKFDILDSTHILVKHNKYNPSGIALKINNIDLNEHHKVAKYPSKACKQIQEFMVRNRLVNSPVLGHNLSFDFRFLHALHEQGNSKFSFLGEKIDTLQIWRELKIKGKISPEFNGKLKTLSNYLGVNYDGAHDAIADCKITAMVYQNLLKLS